MDQQPKHKTSSNPAVWIPLIVILALVVVGGWYFLFKNNDVTNTNQQVNTNSAINNTYKNTTLGFQLTLPIGWTTADKDGFKADVVFQSPKARDCGCAVYVTREDNSAGLTVDAWLTSTTPKKDAYISQVEYDRRRASSDPAEKAQAGTYTQATGQLGNQSALVQEYQTEGGGYVRYLVSYAGGIYALTLWSDGYYFTDETKQTQFDGGQLKMEADLLVTSYQFLQ